MKRANVEKLDKTALKSDKKCRAVESRFGSNPDLKSFDERDRAAFHEV